MWAGSSFTDYGPPCQPGKTPCTWADGQCWNRVEGGPQGRAEGSVVGCMVGGDWKSREKELRGRRYRKGDLEQEGSGGGGNIGIR